MKVLFVTHSFPRYSGDMPGSFLLRLAVALRNEDVEVSVLAPAAPGLAAREILEGVCVERFRYAPRSFETLAYTGNMAEQATTTWRGRLALAGFLAAELARIATIRSPSPPEVVHAHWWFPSGLAARLAAPVLRRPMVTTMHGTDVRLAASTPAARPFFRSVLKGSKAITTVSSWLASSVTELAPEAAPLIVPMPVATDMYAPGGSRESARLLFVGRFNKQKGLEHLIRAVPMMKALTMVDVIGEGPDAVSLKLLASQLGVSDRFVWHGQLSQERVADHYRTATALVMPSIGEGLGLVAVEALLCETPVVAFRSGGLPDVVQHERTGILVPPGETSALARALDDIITSPETAARLGAAGRAFALDAFSPRTVARRYSDIYRGVLGNPHA